MAKVTVQSKQNLRLEITSGKNTIAGDEPVEAGGEDTGLDPYALLLASLGACTALTLKLYARHKNWDLQSITVELAHDKIHAEDCATCETKEGRIDQIRREIYLVGNLTVEQQQRLREIAKRCPIHRTLTSEVSIMDL